MALAPCAKASAQVSDSDRLGMALDYFQSGKYHEARLLLQKLNARYRLNPRFKAYLGVCCYYEWDYKQATTLLDSVIPQLSAFAPQERSVYYFANAESHFFLEQYNEALPLYQTMLSLCKPNEMPDAFYRIGFIHTYRHEWIAALDNLQSALVYYRRHRPEEQARIAQIRNMIKGCCDKIKQGQ
jgi:hypothetical protein